MSIYLLFFNLKAVFIQKSMPDFMSGSPQFQKYHITYNDVRKRINRAKICNAPNNMNDKIHAVIRDRRLLGNVFCLRSQTTYRHTIT